jgi:hypothetical protein
MVVEETEDVDFIEHIDCRQWLPTDPGMHGAVGGPLDDCTVRSVFAQQRFPELISFLVRQAFKGSIVSLACHAGHHRSYTAAATLTSILNLLVQGQDREGFSQRICNAKHFPLTKKMSLQEARDTMANAKAWNNGPWLLSYADEVYGRVPCSMNPQSWKNWQVVDVDVKSMLQYYREQQQMLEEGPPKKKTCLQPAAPSAGGAQAELERAWQAAVADDGTASEQPGGAGQQVHGDGAWPQPEGAEEAWSGADQQGHGDGAWPSEGAEEASGADQQGHGDGAWPSEGAEEAWMDGADQQVQGDEAWPQSSGARQSMADGGAEQEIGDEKVVEAWAHTQRGSVHGWKDILEEHGVDRLAQQALFLLAQHSDDGYRQANVIIAKIVKKASATDGQGGLRNASGFVIRSVQNARNDMEWPAASTQKP